MTLKLTTQIPVEPMTGGESRTNSRFASAQFLVGNPIQNFHGEPGSVIGLRATTAAATRQVGPCNEPVMTRAGFTGFMDGFSRSQIQPEPLTTEVTFDLCPAGEIRGSFLGGENESQRFTCNESVTSRADYDGGLYA
jgi:hypothetical protein